MLCGTPLTDLKAGDEVFAQTMLALAEQAEGAGARRIDVAMARAAASWLVTTLPMVDLGAPPDAYSRAGNEHRQFVPVNVYPTRDGHLLLAVGSDGQWRKLTALPGFGVLAREGRATNEGRKADREAIHRDVAAITRGMESGPLVAALTAAGLVACKVLEVPEVLEEPWLAGSLKGTRLPGGRRIRLQPSAVERPGEPRELGPPPAYGQDTARILREIGAGEDEIQRWREEGVAYCAG